MKTEQIPLSQALVHHWFYLPLSDPTPRQISALMATQRHALQAHVTPAAGAQTRGVVNPNYTCGWNASTSTDAVLNGDTVNVEAFFYVASDCSTIILNYSRTWLSSPYYNPMYWHYTNYNVDTFPYCWSHYCRWGDFKQTLAPPYTYFQRNYNATEQAGHDYTQEFANCYDGSQSSCYSDGDWWYIDLGNLS
jgi:hypothetical protein